MFEACLYFSSFTCRSIFTSGWPAPAPYRSFISRRFDSASRQRYCVRAALQHFLWHSLAAIAFVPDKTRYHRREKRAEIS